MSLNGRPVPMPDKKITYKAGKNGTTYVYQTVRAYRNKNGKPTSDEVSIGKKDPDTGMLIPNSNYHRLFAANTGGAEKQPQVKNVRNYGNTAVLHGMAKKIGIARLLEECFPNDWSQILACAMYMLCEGNVMMYMEDWFDETKVDFAERMDDVDACRLFASISDEDRKRFFIQWHKEQGENEYLVYDVTSISTHSNKIDMAEWGYNRDGDNMAQVNFGMFYGVTKQMPICYNLYNGSIPDKTCMEYMMFNANDIGINEARFVMDRGFVTEDNIQCMCEMGHSFVTAMPGQRLDAVALINENRQDVRKSANRINGREVYGIKRPMEMYGLDLTAHLYYDPEKQVFDEKELYAHLEKLEDELGKMSRAKRASKRHKEYFAIAGEHTGEISYKLDADKVDARLDRAGFFILLCNDPDISSEDVIRIYRERDTIEKNFDQLKNHLDFKRLRTHLNKTTEGKVFVGFIALILRSYILNMIKSEKSTKRLTFEKVIIELRKIKVLTLSDNNEMLLPLTKLQKTILASLGLDDDFISV